jgi:cell fate (sporulation/competence/biofilm development) regulator YlbF (YheA/YmcA/DUF963 family)
MDEIIKLAEELGKKIAAEAVTKTFVERQQVLAKDQIAQKLVEEFQKHAQKLAQLEAQGRAIEVGEKHKLSDLQAQLAGNMSVKEFMTAQMRYMDLMRRVNQAVMAQLGDANDGAGAE